MKPEVLTVKVVIGVIRVFGNIPKDSNLKKKMFTGHGCLVL
jgi:hypothetical protein